MRRLSLLLGLAALAACSEPGDQNLERRGASVYRSACIACHNPDPSRDGTLGPAVAGSSRALIEARVLRAAYPDGYTPKRTTSVMPQMPWLEPEIDALSAYLAASVASSTNPAPGE